MKAHRLQLEARCSSAPRVPAPSSLQSDPCQHTSRGSWSMLSPMTEQTQSYPSNFGWWRGAQPASFAQCNLGRRWKTDEGLTKCWWRGSQLATNSWLTETRQHKSRFCSSPKCVTKGRPHSVHGSPTASPKAVAKSKACRLNCRCSEAPGF